MQRLSTQLPLCLANSFFLIRSVLNKGCFYLLQVTPKFCKQYARVGDVINKALLEYKEEVTNGSFPSPSHSPYKMNADDVNGFFKELEKLGLDKAASAATEAAEKMDTAHNAQTPRSPKETK